MFFYSLLVFFHFTLFWYHKENAKLFDFELLENNAEMIFYQESWGVIRHAMGRTYFHLLIAFTTLFLILEFGWQMISRGKFLHLSWSSKIKKMIIYATIYVVTFFVQVDGYDALQGATRSAVKIDSYDFYDHDIFKKVDTNNYLYKKKFEFKKPHFGRRPNIILLLVESLNGELLGEVAKGTEIKFIPNFEKISESGLLLDDFYGNSVQTDKGMFALLCSLIPSFEKREFKFFSNDNFNCISELLKNNGYKTTFFQAYRDLSFANKQFFLERNGFEVVDTVARHLLPGDKKHSWGWGLQDDYYYKRFFEYMDREWHSGDKPFFTTLLTVSSHMAFRNIPNHLKKVYPGYSGRDVYKNYANAIHFADESLVTFFTEFKKRPFYQDTLVIIMGDHSYPVGKHGYFVNHIDAYNDTFKTPLLLYWDGVIAPSKFQGKARSQMDIAPTIMDIVGISAETHFLGESIFLEPSSPIYLIQPFNGVFLSIVDDNYKYILRKKRKQERLFDLSIDSAEKNNLLYDPKYSQILEKMRNNIGNILVNQKLLINDRIWER